MSLHVIDVAWASAEVVGEGAELLHLLSQDAVESETGLEEAHVAWTETDLVAEIRGQLSELLVVGAQS